MDATAVFMSVWVAEADVTDVSTISSFSWSNKTLTSAGRDASWIVASDQRERRRLTCVAILDDPCSALKITENQEIAL